jgi:excisionase family DNA binding protein
MSKPKSRKPKTEYTPPEIARMYGVTRERVRQWIIEGKLPATRRGWHYYVAAADCHRPPKGKTGPKGPRKRKARVRHRGA